MRDSSETLDGIQILEEFKTDLGTVFWRTVRDVGLWAETPPDSRAGLFSSQSAAHRVARHLGAEIPAELSMPLESIATMLSTPEAADPRVLSASCMHVGAWAAKQQGPHTALAYCQAAALALPEDPQPALQTGFYANAAGQGIRAVTWFRRAIALARRTRQWEAYAHACLAIGEHYEQKAPKLAEQHFRLASRAGRRHGLRVIRMRAAYGRFRVAINIGDVIQAEDHARATQAAYTDAWPGTPQLLLHLSRFWIERQQPRRAGPALRRITPLRGNLTPAEQLLIASMAARVHAAAERAGPAARAAGEVRHRMQHLSVDTETQLTAALDLTHTAILIHDEPGFREARNAALRIVDKEEFVALRAELEALARRAGFAGSQESRTAA
jgi:tetratricopeptide (TPR) repeat protein